MLRSGRRKLGLPRPCGIGSAYVVKALQKQLRRVDKSCSLAYWMPVFSWQCEVISVDSETTVNYDRTGQSIQSKLELEPEK